MWGWLKKFRGNSGSSPNETPSRPDTDTPSIPSFNRREVIEGSPEPTYLVPNSDLRESLIRLHALEVEIVYGEENDRNLITDLLNGFRSGDFPQLTQVNQYLAKETIERLLRKSDAELNGKYVVLGELLPDKLKAARNVKEFVRVLTLNYPNSDTLVGEFESTAIVGANFSGKVIDQAALDALVAPRATSVGAESDRRSRFDLLQIVTDVFSDLGEPISFGRLKFLNPYIPGIASCPEDRRNDIVEKILNDRYPFNSDNRDAWHAEIRSAMSPGGY